MKQRSYFKCRLEIENKLEHARPLLKMICKDKWKCLKRNFFLKKAHTHTRALGLKREIRQEAGGGEEGKGVMVKCQSTDGTEAARKRYETQHRTTGGTSRSAW